MLKDRLKSFRASNGFTTTFFAVLMPVLILILGLCADGSIIIYNKIALDTATDAAAVSSSDSYNRDLWWTPPHILELRRDAAENIVRDVLQQNMPRARLVSLEILPSKKECKIETVAEIPMFFMKLFQIESYTIRASSIGRVY
ncbi:TadE/TadG family type IV pilus assembly protein [Paenibacillus koleovorans]|uniref:TadE/TadG family type IV pilus assembly protein n=1 Tax=Paenibacillus koleovorans TaxID=121608 RepID=UPI000FDB9E58|nr:TadE/TadG family type IV pilus assembly protein [Paenibacillus koleovorans]